MRKNTIPVIKVWWCQEKFKSVTSDELPETSSRKVTPMWTTEKFATIFLQSEVAASAIVPKIVEKSPNTMQSSNDEAKVVAARKTKTAIIENLSAKPAKRTEPGQDASTCASGSQKENGNIGTFASIATVIPTVASHDSEIVSSPDLVVKIPP